MKRIIALMVFAAALAGCKEGTTEVAPSMISNLTATPGEGTITLSWDNPAAGDYYYSQIQFVDPVDGKLKKRNVSNHVSTYTIDGLYRKNGDYTFKVYPVSSTHTLGSQSLEVTSRALAVPSTWAVESTTKIALVSDQLASNATDPSEGSLGGLLDGDLSTFWHANWHSPVPFPQYWTIKLGKEVEGVKLNLRTRQHATNHAINEAELLATNQPDDVPDDEITDWVTLTTFPDVTFPNGNAALWESPAYSTFVENNYKFRRLKLNVKSVQNSYWVYSELEVFDVKYVEYDPEL